MQSNILFFGWNRPVPGRERPSAELFGGFVEYLVAQQKNGAIESFEPVFLNLHGGDLNGFILIRAKSSQLDALVSTSEWETQMSRAFINLEGSGNIRGVGGELIRERMTIWSGLLAS